MLALTGSPELLIILSALPVRCIREPIHRRFSLYEVFTLFAGHHLHIITATPHNPALFSLITVDGLTSQVLSLYTCMAGAK